MSREPIRFRNSLITKRCLKVIPWGISRRFHRLSPWNGQVAHALRTLAPVAIKTSTNLRPMLPLDLHVLSLPLAFILSQDQTLHCIISYKFLSLSLTLHNSSKELTLLDKLYFFSVLACTVSSLFNELVVLSASFWVSRQACAFSENSKNQLRYFLFRNPFLIRGCKGRHYFLISKSFFKNFQFLFFASVFPKNSCLYRHPFFKWECKGTTFLFTSKFFCNNP